MQDGNIRQAKVIVEHDPDINDQHIRGANWDGDGERMCNMTVSYSPVDSRLCLHAGFFSMQGKRVLTMVRLSLQ